MCVGHDRLGTSKGWSVTFEGVSTWQVGCSSPLVGEVTFQAFTTVFGQLVVVEHNLVDFTSYAPACLTQRKWS